MADKSNEKPEYREQEVAEGRYQMEMFLAATTPDTAEILPTNKSSAKSDEELPPPMEVGVDEEESPLNQGVKKDPVLTGEQTEPTFVYEDGTRSRESYYRRRLELERADTTIAAEFFAQTSDAISMTRTDDMRARVPAELASVLQTALARHGITLKRDQSPVCVALTCWLLSGAPVPDDMQFSKKSLAEYGQILGRWKRSEFVWQAIVEEQTLAGRALLEISEADLFKTVVSPEARRRAIRALTGQPQVRIPKHIREEGSV